MKQQATNIDWLIAKAHIALLIASLFWSTAYIGIHVGLTSLSPGALALLRYSVASICMLGFYFRPHRENKLKGFAFIYVLCLGMFGFGLYNIVLNQSELIISAGCASFVIGQVPVLTSILAVIFLKERLAWLAWLGLAVSICGVTLLAIGEPHHHVIEKGMIYILLAAIISSLFWLIQKPILSKIHPFELISVAMWGGTLFLAILYLPALSRELPHASTQAIDWVVFIGLFPAALSYALWYYGISILPLSIATSYLYIMPMMTLLLSMLLFSRYPSVLAVLGGLLAVFGCIMVTKSAKKMKN